MSTSTLYDTTLQALQQHLPAVRASQRDALALAVAGAVQSQASQLAALARALPLDSSQLVKEQRIRRLLGNPRITQAQHYHPVVQQALHGLTNQRVHLILDRVLLRNQHNLLVISLGFRRRSLPLAWLALPHRGASTLAERQQLVTIASQLLPPGVHVTVHGDNEFRSFALYRWLRARGYDVMLGVAGHVTVYAHPTAVGRPLRQLVARQAQRLTCLTQVHLTQEARYGPLNVLAWRERDADGKEVIRGAVTNLPATARTKQLGKRRMWIETVFRDWQSGGFHLDRTGIRDGQRLLGLVLVLCLAYLWLVSVGRWVVKRGYRYKVDDGGPRSWHYSLFQLGVGWLQHRLSRLRSFPMLFYLYT